MSQAATPAAPEKPKTAWERIVTSTPILLTVVATVLAGLSSSEMTRSQYYRSLAAQNQSKVSDQWNFFQAKRLRGTDMDGTAIVLRSTTGAGQVSPESLRASAQRLSQQLKRAEKEADALAKAAGAAGSSATDLGPPADQFRDATKAALAASDKLVKKLDALAKEAPRSPTTYLSAGAVPERAARDAGEREQLTTALEAVKPEVRKSLGYFDPGLLLRLNDRNPAIPEAVREVNERKTERDMGGTLARISEDQIHESIDDAEKTARQFEDACAPITAALRDLDRLIADQIGAARGCSRASQEVSVAAATLAPGDAKQNDVRQAASAVVLAGAMLKSTSDELGNDFKAAQLGYDSRRYEREARDNQAVAGLYELDVRKASLQSDRHRTRSTNFFYAMLAAQGGVTIATFSIAMRRRSLLWALATVAGVAALALGVYVYLRM